LASFSRDTVAGNIYSGTYVGGDNFGIPTAYDTIGEICEVKGFADDATQNPASREAAVRRIANDITVRSSTFTICVWAQSIKQPAINPNPGTFNPNTDVITGDVKAQAVVERYENPPGSAPKYRTRYFRYLYN
jgi:hypothetical protein